MNIEDLEMGESKYFVMLLIGIKYIPYCVTTVDKYVYINSGMLSKLQARLFYLFWNVSLLMLYFDPAILQVSSKSIYRIRHVPTMRRYAVRNMVGT